MDTAESADIVAVNDEAILLRTWLLGEDAEKQIGAAAVLCKLLDHLLVKKPEFVLELFARLRGNGNPVPIVPGNVSAAFWGLGKSILQNADPKVGMVARMVINLMRVFRPHWSVGGDCIAGDAPPVGEVAPVILEVADKNFGDFSGYVMVLLGMYGPEAAPYLDDVLRRLSKHRRDCMRAPGLTWAALQIAPAHTKVLTLIKEIDADARCCPHSREIVHVFLVANGLKQEN